MGSFDKLKATVLSNRKFLLICHERPDGDSIGSMLSFSEALKSLGKSVTAVSCDSVPKVFSFLKGSEDIKHDFKTADYEVVVSLDNGDCRRTGFYDRISEIKKLKIPFINIDHHPKNDLWRIADVNYVKSSLSSTCEIVYEIILGLKIEITPEMATALLTGIFTDTGGFQHTNTSENVFMITSDLLNKGAKLRKISENIANSRSVSMLKLWGIALNRLTSVSDLSLVYSLLTKEDIKKVGASEEEVSGLVNLINSIPESKISLLLYETEDGKIKGSLRTESEKVDLSKVAAIFNGGGHKKASGFSISGQLKKNEGKWQII